MSILIALLVLCAFLSGFGLKWLLDAAREPPASDGWYQLGDRVTKRSGSKWTGRIVGTYSTDLTEHGYAVESETERGSVQIYPEAALMPAPKWREPK